MCLITRSGRISICEKDIICYKILRKSDNCFKSLYFPYTYYLNNIYREKDLEIKKNIIIYIMMIKYMIVIINLENVD